MAVDGVALGCIAVGAALTYAGIKGKSVPSLVQGFVQGKTPAAAQSANPIAASGDIVSTSGTGTTPGGPAGHVSATGSEQSFFTAFLKDIGAPATNADLMSMYAWAQLEEPQFPPQNAGGYAWNPLNIKNAHTGEFEVWDSAEAGASGTAAFMLDNNYSAIVSALRAGKGLCGADSAVAAELSAWSDGGYSAVC